MQMDAGLDTGPVLLEQELAISVSDTTGTLTDRLAALAAEVLPTALDRLHLLTPVPQPAAGVTYASKIGKAEALLDFSQPADLLERKIRALNPSPGCLFQFNGALLKVLAAEKIEGVFQPGEIIRTRHHLEIGCGDGGLRVLTVQRQGSLKMTCSDFLRAFP